MLAEIALRPMILPQTVAAQQRYRYVAVRASYPSSPQPELDKYAPDGWELAGAYANADYSILIFRK